MPHGLRELVKRGDVDAFEARCLELLEAGDVPLEEMAGCLQQLEGSGQAARAATIGQTIIENTDVAARAREALPLASATLLADPRNESLRKTVSDLYRRVYGDLPGFEGILESSGLATGVAPRTALRVLDFCLALNVSDALISRMDGRVAEVVEVDRQRGLFTLRRAGDRATTIPARELVREFERVDAEDVRVLRQLRPERLNELIERDPVAVVIGMIRAHGEQIDADQLKHELVPQHIAPPEWSKWWTNARAKLKRSPHVIVEGRAPIILRYSEEGISLEQETWTALTQQKDPEKWLATIEGYLRELRARHETPDSQFVQRVQNQIAANIEATRRRRPAEALVTALVLEEIQEAAGLEASAGPLIAGLLRDATAPADLIVKIKDEGLCRRVLAALPAARPQDWGDIVTHLLPRVAATQLDHVAEAIRAAGRLSALQQHIDDALANVVDYPELVYWMWRGVKNPEGLRLPTDAELFDTVLDTVIALDTSLTPASAAGKNYRNRVKAAFSLRDYAKVSACLRQTTEAAATGLRRQIERLSGLGDNARIKMLDVLRDAHPQLWVHREVRLAPWEDPETVWATPAGIQRRTAERDELVNVKMRENAKRIGEAGALGDLSENSEYKFALEERDFLRARLAQINRELSLAQPLSPHDVPRDHVGIGTRVRLLRTDDSSERVLTILGPFEADVENHVYSYKAPVCQRILGLRPGERVVVPLEGVDHEYEVATIEPALGGP